MTKFSKNFAFCIFVLTFAFCILNLSVYAVDYTVDIPGYTPDPESAAQSFSNFLSASFIFIIATCGILALLMIMIGGFQYITAGGNEARAGQGKSRIQNAIIGLILALCSYLILNTINPDLAELAHLPGLEKITTEGVDLKQFLPEEPKAGESKGNVPDGGECAIKQDCWCSRDCLPWWKCPAVATSPVFATATECNAKTICNNPAGQNEKSCESTYDTVKSQGTRYCTPMFDKTGKIGDQIACGFTCGDEKSDKWPNQCADNGYVCHMFYNNTCHKISGFREFCDRDTDCDQSKGYFCDSAKKYCTNKNDTPSEGETLPETKQAEVLPGYSGLGKNCKDIYYLFNSAMLWVSSNLDGTVRDTDKFSMVQNKDACDGLASPKLQAQDGSTVLCQPDMNQFTGGSLFTAPGETKKRIKWIKVGYAQRELQGAGYYGNAKSCKESYGPAFYDVDKDFCEHLTKYCPKNQQLPTSDDYDTGKCCGVLYTCGTQQATVPTCRGLLATQGFKTADKITQPDIDRCIDELNLTITKKEKERSPMICCEFEGSVAKKTQGDGCDPNKNYECCNGLVCKAGENKCLAP